ncbi:PREDICTED: uncharacterized protein LOC106744669 isoform X2 [Dinoponera quadriceps]|uniref:Uncharacterized protein LOC106744669 isoform X2 n=1 Tax=Dinoponera quadriceps TaxID=609295 RepID=A0A6P3XA00_DINQU|nr:PREDICTED: uncharacterized protein LOC106744669 isoform X2 [Dinoponera quadriceps]
MMGRYKLVRDKSEYSTHYGYTGNDPSYPKYNATNMLASPVASAIASVSSSVLNADKIEQLREESTVVCRTSDFSNCTNRTCLFDVREDPCETTDLSSMYLEVVERLNAFIDGHKSVINRSS